MSTLKVNNITDLGNDAVVTSGILDTLAVPAGGILQVVSTTKTDVFSQSLSAGALSDLIPDLTVTITPSSTSSKILIVSNIDSQDGVRSIVLLRDTTEISFGDASGSIRQSHTQGGTPHFLDSPATTSAITYGVKLCSSASTTVYLNRRATESNNTSFARTVSTLTVMEVAG